jgi:hypothetical protein
MTLPPSVTELTSTFLAEVDDRLPGRLTALFLHGSLCWGEFHPTSDVDFVAVWDTLPQATDLDALRAAHEATTARHAAPAFDGLHCTAADLAAPPAEIAGHRPVYFQAEFDPTGRLDMNPVTWHELSERAVTIRGTLPPIHTDLAALLAFTHDNLDTYWRAIATQVDEAGVEAVGKHDDSVAFIGLGPARLHHVLSTGTLTSKSGAGRYILECLDQRWHRIAQESLRLRETPHSPSLYDNPTTRGQDAADLLNWLIADGTAKPPTT